MSGAALRSVAGCPSEDTLAAFAVGELSDAALSRVAQHAGQCAACGLQLMAADGQSALRSSPHTELLDDRYRLVRKLGAGGMAVVYEADDLVLGERVALKLLRVELASDARALEYLKSEAKLSRQIGHAHVCRVFDLGSQTAQGRTVQYLSMELLRGPSLRSLLAHGALDPALALRLADQLLCGLQAAHAAGVLHRDLKPDNMLLRYPSPHAPHAVITDFGLARAFQAGQRHIAASRTLVGSAAYLAPEQVEEAPLTEATDLYSFGVVLFELLTGEQPFRGETPLGIALKRLHNPAPRPSAARPELGERYDSFVLRCMARDPRQRFQSAASARAALLTLVGAEPAAQTRSFARTGKLIGAALSVLCVASAASVWPTEETPPRAQPAPSSPKLATMQADLAWQNDLPLALPPQLHPLAADSGVPPDAACREAEARSNIPHPQSASSRAEARTRAANATLTKPAAPPTVLTADGFLDPFAH